MFFWQSIGNARIGGRIWKITKSARSSRAEPEREVILLCEVTSAAIYYAVTFQNEFLTRYRKKLWGYPDFRFCDQT